jgi:mannose-1-phosphate guanylyltransferase/mannose-6-phosphate isomerase
MPEDVKTVPDQKIAKRLIHPVILSGGSGTRLWPMSRAAYPKQLQPLLSERSLLQDSVARVLPAHLFAAPIILANEEHRFIIAEQLRQIDVKPQTIMLEPVARNTAPAAAAAALWLGQREPDALMLIMPSDHAIADPSGLPKAIEIGAQAAASASSSPSASQADRPETGYGYIRRPPRSARRAPTRSRPSSRSRTGRAGRAISRVGRLYLEQRHLPVPGPHVPGRAQGPPCRRPMPRSRRRSPAKRAISISTASMPRPSRSPRTNESIDYAVMEHTANAAVVPVAMGWSDVGAWDALWDITPKGDDGMVQIGDVTAVDCRNSYLRTEERLLAAVGVEDLIVVATADAVLVAPKSRAQDVKKLIDRMKLDKRDELTHLPTVHRPWGTYRSIHNGDRVQVKHIMVKPGGKLSLQMHHHRAEHWVVVQGTAKIVRGDDELMLTENQSTYIPLGALHRLENPGRIPLHLIEVQSGSYLGEDDIVRFEDTYGRA